MKKSIGLVLLMICLMVPAVGVYAGGRLDSMEGIQAFYENSETGYIVSVNDNAGYMTADEQLALVDSMSPLTQYGNVLFLSYIDDGENDIGQVSEWFYHSYYGNGVSGVIFTVNPSALYIFSDGYMYEEIGKDYAYTITDNIYQEASDDNIYNTCVDCYGMILDIMEGRRIAQPMKYICNALLALMISVMISFIYIKTKASMGNLDVAKMLSDPGNHFDLSNQEIKLIGKVRQYSPRSSGGGSSGGGGGGGSSGGGGGHSR